MLRSEQVFFSIYGVRTITEGPMKARSNTCTVKPESDVAFFKYFFVYEWNHNVYRRVLKFEAL